MNVLFSLAGKNSFLDGIFIFLAEYVIFLMALCLIWIFLGRAKREKILFLIAVTGVFLGRLVFTPLIRFFYFRPRPFVADSFIPLISHNPAEASFPSGHTIIMFVMAFVVFSYHRKLGIIFFILAFLSAASRVIAGVHYPVDILGGILLAYISFILSKKLVAISRL